MKTNYEWLELYAEECRTVRARAKHMKTRERAHKLRTAILTELERIDDHNLDSETAEYSHITASFQTQLSYLQNDIDKTEVF